MGRTALLLLLLAAPLLTAQEKKPPAANLEARLHDGTRLRLAVLDESLPIQTAHGRLVVPLADIRRVDFGARLPEALRKQIDAAIAGLGSTEVSQRDAAGAALVKIGPRAYPAVMRATKSADRELAISARRLREKFFDSFSEQHLPEHDLDVIHTDDSKIAGRIEAASIRVHTPHFGAKTLRVIDIAGIRAANAPAAEEQIAAQPDPGNLTNFANQVGKSFHFKVTGNPSGSIYGTDLYTTDSTLATACVHAGVLKPGETGVVRVTIEPGANSYTASTRHGVTSNGWGPYSASYKVRRAGAVENK